MQQKEDAVIQVKDLYKVYRMGEEKVYALNPPGRVLRDHRTVRFR